MDIDVVKSALLFNNLLPLFINVTYTYSHDFDSTLNWFSNIFLSDNDHDA